MLIDFGKAGWIEKARKQPDKVRQVLDKVKTDGLLPTMRAVQSKLDQPIPLGYCNVGRIQEVGSGITESEFRAGDRVVSNGPHAEVVWVPKNLCAKVPEPVSDEEAAFTVVGAIGLQGIRLLGPTLGESFVVTGLGLIGLLSVQILRAHGCRVLGIDLDPAKCALARQFGAETVDLSKGADPLLGAAAFTRERGVDGVLITASARSNELVHQAALMCRKRGRIVLVGVVGLDLSRADFYEKELSFQVSCSYGPGRYDENYEQQGQDYPLGFVRWTEQRNFGAILELMADRRLDVRPLITHRCPFVDSLSAYETVGSGKALGIVLQYAGSEPSRSPGRTVELPKTAPVSTGKVVVGVIGAGGFTGQVLLPALKKTGARLKAIASAAGVTSTHLGKRFGFELSTTDTSRIFADPEINTVVITTRHNSHARYVLEGLRAGKRVYVEKPLCLTRKELDEIRSAYEQAAAGAASGGGPFLMVGFNRRFAPQVVRMKSLMAALNEPKTLIYTVNAGMIPANHWSQDPSVGGGRILGEGCHFVDVLRFLVGRPIVRSYAARIGGNGVVTEDKMTFTVTFEDGSVGTVHYFANGHKSFPKERLEVFCAGRILQLDNFRKLRGYGWPGFSKLNLWSQDKGHTAEMAALVDGAQEGVSPIGFGELVEVTRECFAIAEQRWPQPAVG